MLIKHEKYEPLNCEQTEGNLYIWFNGDIHVYASLPAWDEEITNSFTKDPIEGYCIDTRFSPYQGRSGNAAIRKGDEFLMYYGTVLNGLAWSDLGDVPEFPVEFKTQMMLLGIS